MSYKKLAVAEINLSVYMRCSAGFNINCGLNTIQSGAMQLLCQSQLHNRKFLQPSWLN
jgi:hypothetical protein